MVRIAPSIIADMARRPGQTTVDGLQGRAPCLCRLCTPCTLTAFHRLLEHRPPLRGPGLPGASQATTRVALSRCGPNISTLERRRAGSNSTSACPANPLLTHRLRARRNLATASRSACASGFRPLPRARAFGTFCSYHQPVVWAPAAATSARAALPAARTTPAAEPQSEPSARSLGASFSSRTVAKIANYCRWWYLVYTNPVAPAGYPKRFLSMS